MEAGAPPTNDLCVAELPPECLTPEAEVTPEHPLGSEVTTCRVIRKAGTYVNEYVNVLKGGSLYFVEDAAGATRQARTIDFRVKSMLVEYGGLVQAGSAACPFGQHGGLLSIGLYGDDPTHEGKTKDAPPGIQCKTTPGAAGMAACLPAGLDPTAAHYCTDGDSPDTCASTSPSANLGWNETGKNELLEPYHDMPFDPTPFGYKTLSVSYGGALRFFGYKGTAGADAVEPKDEHCAVPTVSTLDAKEMQAWADLTGTSWTRLTKQSDDGDETILELDRAVGDWGVGDQIVIGTTDWYPGHSETRAIERISVSPDGDSTRVWVAKLAYPHATSMFDTDALPAGTTFTDHVNREAVDLRAPVGLLSRSIQVRSLGATADSAFPAPQDCVAGKNDPTCYFGGHVMFRQGFRDVQIQGVEFKQLGQGGRMGHYPVHFHLAKSTAYTKGKAFVKDSSIWDSMNRFITLHGTQGVTLARNVGYLSVGHGYYLEDGSEVDNRLCHNLGIGARAAINEYYAAQADPAGWPGGVAPPSARFVPPILDGMTDPAEKERRTRAGSDSLMPVMYWVMSGHNELVGNAAAGVHGFGSCFWLLGSQLSGMSKSMHQFDGMAAYNRNGAMAPLLRFRGNTCSTAALALPTSIDMPPADLTDASLANDLKLTPVENPYAAIDPSAIPRPIQIGNFRPTLPGAKSTNCSDYEVVGQKALDNNTGACVMTVIDRFATSFNWTEVNFGSVWLRPGFFYFTNGAITDQLGGGLTFVTGGSWMQVPPGYFALAKNSLFVGTTQFRGSPYAKRSGPILRVTKQTPLQPELAMCTGGKVCRFPEQGTGYWSGLFQPKRLLNIYDGPAYADGNTYLNVGAWECDPQPCAGKTPEACFDALPCASDDPSCATKELPCGIYGSTRQPTAVDATDPAAAHRMMVLDAAIGWKQPNGFYYPPSFAHRASNFFATPPPAPDGKELNGLNQCFAPDADGTIALRAGDCRHNAVDRTRSYVIGSYSNVLGAANVTPPDDPTHRLDVSPIDFQTVLVDLDGTLTGVQGKLSGTKALVPTVSISRNAFFDAPVQSPECLSFGVQTSPYQAVTSVVAPVKATPTADSATSVYLAPGWETEPMVAIYRQFLLAGEEASTCGQVCGGAGDLEYACPRASFMMGPSVWEAPHLTLTLPPGVPQPAGGMYYIDTSTGAKQPVACVAAKPGGNRPATFMKNGTYVVYDMFAKSDTKSSYSMYVGTSDLAVVKPRFVRVTPHEVNGADFRNVQVRLDCDPTSDGAWCADLVKLSADGVLTVTLDQSFTKERFAVSAHPEHERCMPRDMCYFDATAGRCRSCLTHPGAAGCSDRAFLPVDVASMNTHDASQTSPLDVLCEDWSTFASGAVAGDPGEISLSECPSGGCLGVTFTLPADFAGDKTYADVNPPTSCFDEAEWTKNALVPRMSGGKLVDPLCGLPKEPESAGFCSGP